MNHDLACNEIEEQEPRRVVLVIPRQHVKTVKTALERHGKLDQTIKILPERPLEPGDDATEQGVLANQVHHAASSKMRIATTISYQLGDQPMNTYHQALLLELTHDLDISHISDDISILYHTLSASETATVPKNPLHKALHSALFNLPDTVFTALNITRHALVSSFPDGYSIYTPLLLLPSNALTSLPWTTLLAAHLPLSSPLQPLWSSLASAMNVTHIAINSPIPPTQSSSPSDNILRSPLNITPLFGDFGTTPTEANKAAPAQQDFDQALWVSTTQNGIIQVWAPLYTMFSRGNIREKTRVLGFPGPSSSGNEKAREAVLDMYAGIGYFAFSYRASSFRPIYCFELNPWSVEGLRRGAVRNGWSVKIYTEDDISNITTNIVDHEENSGETGNGDVDFHIFHSSNAHALPILLSQIHPPIRHVNLGLLPHSRDSWRDAVALVDSRMGGWIHAHENVGVGEMEERREEAERVFQGYLDELEGGEGRKARVEHVERVKMYAPGVVHVVFDVRIEGEREAQES